MVTASCAPQARLAPPTVWPSVICVDAVWKQTPPELAANFVNQAISLPETANASAALLTR